MPQKGWFLLGSGAARMRLVDLLDELIAQYDLGAIISTEPYTAAA
jgi:hypothetical protein